MVAGESGGSGGTRFAGPAPVPPRRWDVVLIGGGIIGAAVAREVGSRYPHWRILLLEREGAFAVHQSGHNSGVIHAGLYYRPGSLKARLCVEGNRLLYRYCEKKGLPFRRCGKLVVAVCREEVKALRALARQAQENGVPGLRLIDGGECARIEPHCRAVTALYSPTSGVTDYRRITAALVQEFQEGGGQVALGCEVVGLRRRPRGLLIHHSGGETVTSYAIVCAGAWSDRLLEPAQARELAIVPFAGHYRQLAEPSASLVCGLIYPVPDPRLPFLGVHFTRHLDGTVTVGPNALPALRRRAGAGGSEVAKDLLAAATFPGAWRFLRRWWRTGLREGWLALSPAAYSRACRRYLPDLAREDLRAGPVGLRAQALLADGALLDDFRYTVAGRALYLENAPSPGATAALALAQRLVEAAARAFGWPAPRRSASP